jgi:hypothetical protein
MLLETRLKVVGTSKSQEKETHNVEDTLKEASHPVIKLLRIFIFPTLSTLLNPPPLSPKLLRLGILLRIPILHLLEQLPLLP